MPDQRYMEENGLAAMLAAGVTSAMKHVKCILLQSTKKADHSGFGTYEMAPDVQNKSVSVPCKRTYALQKIYENKANKL